VELELDPEQPAAVVRAVDDLLRSESGAVDPWWQAGLDESLGSGDC
jgi:hypothetical protein